LAIHDTDCREGERSNDYLRLADLILANRHLWQAGGESMTAVDYFDPELSEIRITLPEPERDAARNAQIYYRRYARARSRGENGRRFLEADLAEVSWLESIQAGLTSAADLTDLAAIREELTAAGLTGERLHPDLQPQAEQQPGVAGSRRRRQSRLRQQKGGKPAAKGPAPLPPRQYTSSDGLTILVGRNNLQNDQLTLKTAQKDDLWFHVQKLPGTHVIVRANRLTVPDRTIAEAAGIAAWFSRASAALPGRNRPDTTGSSDGQKIAVDYCPVSQVRKPSGARPGHVIYDHYQTILVAPRDPSVLSRSVP
jgi:predicted ribosome quality control (RQC) complex YloA/Tae2 family protein